MPVIVNNDISTVIFDSNRYYFFVPHNIQSGTIHYEIVGGGGGGAGADAQRGGSGSGAGRVIGNIEVNAGDVVEVFVGAGGSRSTTTIGVGNAQGGAGGISLQSFAGGHGGSAGPRPWSGGGGGGGGATVIKVNGRIKAVAGGGAGGGGGGCNTGGEDAVNYITSRNTRAESTYYPKIIPNGAYCSFLNVLGIDARGGGDSNDSYGLRIDADGNETYINAPVPVSDNGSDPGGVGWGIF
jgi:hypothetical protein